jgi:1,4-dihydroxy-6-naphthoate synthase
MATNLTLAFSPCPNDTFMFAALANGWIDSGNLQFNICLADIEQLNQMAVHRQADILKISIPALTQVSADYVLLPAGSALGKNCGPLLVARKKTTRTQMAHGKVAIPGRLTTANLLLSLFYPEIKNKVEMVFSDIARAIHQGMCDAGVIIHESRFTYRQMGLTQIADLGMLWEDNMRMPLPLGVVAGKRTLGKETLLKVTKLIRQSIQFARLYPSRVMDYVRQHASEMDEQIMHQHIHLYVNDYSIELKAPGVQSIAALAGKGAEAGLLNPLSHNFYLPL